MCKYAVKNSPHVILYTLKNIPDKILYLVFSILIS